MSQPSSGRWGCFSMFVVLLLAVSLLLNLVLFAGSTFGTPIKDMLEGPVAELDEVPLDDKAGPPKIAVIDVVGLITDERVEASEASTLDETIQQLKRAREDSDVKAVIVRFDSPGGEVNASDVLYHEVAKVREKKPVVAFFKSMAASGAYYAAMGASCIIANDQTITGSVGVIMQSLQYNGLMDKVGLRMHTFKSGKFKDLGAGDREMTPEEAAYLQQFVTRAYERFVAIVAKERRLSLAALRSGVADGRILSGEQALSERIVDRLGYFEDAEAKANELAGTKDAALVRYERHFHLSRVLGSLLSARSPQMTVSLLPGSARLTPGRAYYVAPHAVQPGS
jgi:protease-4